MTSCYPDREHAVTLAVVEERLHMSRETVAIGAVQVQMQVQMQVQVQVQVQGRVQAQERVQTFRLHATSEDVEIERVAMHREVDAPQAPWQDGDGLVVPVHEETWVLRKQLVSKEELCLHRRRHTRHWQQDEVLLHDSVNVQRRAADGTWAPVSGSAGVAPPADGP